MDYDEIAKQFGGSLSPETSQFDKLASEFGGSLVQTSPSEKKDTGFTGAAKSTIERIKGETALTLGKVGLMDEKEAEAYHKAQTAKAEQIYAPTEKGWSEAPGEKIRELLGSSVPYAAVPLVAAGAAALAPEIAVAGIGGATLAGLAAGTAQYTGTNLSRQIETGKSLADTNLLSAGAAAVPEAILDRISFGMMPGINRIFKTAGKDVSKEVLEQVAKKGLLATTGEFAAKGVQVATIEGATEVAQAFLERLQAGLDISNAEARDEYFQNFIGGAILGGVVAVPGHAFERATKKIPQDNTPESEAALPKVSETYPTAQPVTMAGLTEVPQAVPETYIKQRQVPVAQMPETVTAAPIEPQAVTTAPAQPLAPALETAPLAAPEVTTSEIPKVVPISAPITELTQKEEPAPKPVTVKQISPNEFQQRIADPNVQESLKIYAQEAGWAEKGGQMLREVADDYSSPVVGRTQWIPNKEWWYSRPVILPGDMNGEATRTAINKAYRGEKLKPKERQMVEFLIRQHDSDMAEGDRQRAELEQREKDAVEFQKQFQIQETPEQAATRTAEEETRIKAQQDADIEAEMARKAEESRQEIARRSKEQAGNFQLGQTPAESLSGQQRISSLDEDIPFFERTPAQFTDDFVAQEKTIINNLRKTMDSMGLKDVGLRIEDALHEIRDGKAYTVSGDYFQKLVRLSLSGNNIWRTMGHESLHAMRDLGFFTDADWKVLTDKANSTWIDKYNIKEIYADKSPEIQIEEAIANAFSDHLTQAPKVKSIMDRVVNILKRIGNVLRGAGIKTAEDIFGKAAAGEFAPTKAPSAKAPLLERKPLTNAPPQSFTKLSPQQTAGEKLQSTAANVKKAWNDDNFWTKWRINWVDPNSGLSKALSKEELFKDGVLRADMLNHAAAQVINLIKNGLLGGHVSTNKDGTLGVVYSDNNLARTQVIADKMDSNPLVKASGLSGRGFVAEVARALRGKEILEEDRIRIAEGKTQLKEARAAVMAAAKARDANAPIAEIRRHLDRAKDLRKQGHKNINMNRERQVTPEQIAWAEKQLKDVPEVKQILDIWKDVNDNLINLWEQVGLLTEQQAADYRSKKSYVPLFKSVEDLTDKPTGLGGSGVKTVKEFKKLQGSDITRNIWENVEKHYASMVASAYQNQTRKVGTEQLKVFELARIVKDGDPDINLRYRDPKSEFADSNGIVHVAIDNPNDLAAFQMMHYELGPLMQSMAAANKVLRAGALLNPMFWIKQLIRDPVHATLVTQSGIITPFHAAADYINVLKGNSREAKILASRGVIGQMDSTVDLHDFLKQVGMEKKSPSILSKALHKALQFHEASDAATRVSLFKDAEKKALAKGMSKEDAINYAVFKARESINFAIHGNSQTVNILRNMIPFLSAAINSLDTVYRAATGYGLNEKEKSAAQKMFIKRAVMMSTLATAYAMLYQGDEDYKKLPDYVKDNNFLFPNPLGDGHTFIKIPIPFEVGFLFKTIPESTVRYIAGTSTGKEVIASYIGGVTNTLPGNGILIPQLAKPALEAIVNHSFFTHRAIENAGEKNLPVAMRGNQRASELAKSLSALGLDKVGLSPAKIDYLIQGYTAELGSLSSGMASSVINLAAGKTTTAKNIEEEPFFRSFMTNPKASKAIADFYDLEHNAQEIVNEFNQYKKFGQVEEIKALVSDEQKRKLMAVAPALRQIGSKMTELRTQMNLIDKNQTMDPEVRREKINALQKIYEQLAGQGEKIANQVNINR